MIDPLRSSTYSWLYCAYVRLLSTEWVPSTVSGLYWLIKQQFEIFREVYQYSFKLFSHLVELLAIWESHYSLKFVVHGVLGSVSGQFYGFGLDWLTFDLLTSLQTILISCLWHVAAFQQSFLCLHLVYSIFRRSRIVAPPLYLYYTLRSQPKFFVKKVQLFGLTL